MSSTVVVYDTIPAIHCNGFWFYTLPSEEVYTSEKLAKIAEDGGLEKLADRVNAIRTQYPHDVVVLGKPFANKGCQYGLRISGFETAMVHVIEI